MEQAFECVIGYEKIKEELRQLCDMVQNREIYERLGAKTPRGILLHGVPGVGKSMLATAFMRASGMTSYTLRRNRSDGDFVNEIRKTFEQAA